FENTVNNMTKMGVIDTYPVPQVLLGGAIAFLVIGSVFVVFGIKTRFGALLLLIFLAAVTPLFHNFWDLEGPEQHAQLINFLKNVGLAGGVLMVIAHGPGLFSLDTLLARSQKR